MKSQFLTYVNASDLFAGCDLALQHFADCDPPCSWGDNAHSLVMKDVLFFMTKEDEEPEVQEQIQTVWDRLDKLPDDVLIDLEN